MAKRVLTVTVDDTGVLFDRVKEAGDGGASLGARIVSALFDESSLAEVVGMAVYGVSVDHEPELLPMDTAPKDGTQILCWCEHHLIDSPEHKGWVIAHWIDHNDGGFTWHGHVGNFLGWKPLPAALT